MPCSVVRCGPLTSAAKSTKVMALHPTLSAVSTRVLLTCHAVHPCQVVSTCEVSVSWQHDGLTLVYRIRGDLDRLLLPAPTPRPGFADGLWQHTCLEAFVAGAGSERYHEFNFSPAGNWAAYAFAAYRQRDRAWQATVAPYLAWQSDAAEGILTVRIPKELLPTGDALQLGLSAITEAADGGLSYWALRHADAKPDFHCSESFCLTLTTPPDSAS